MLNALVETNPGLYIIADQRNSIITESLQFCEKTDRKESVKEKVKEIIKRSAFVLDLNLFKLLADPANVVLPIFF